MDIPSVLRNTPAPAGWAGRRNLELGVQGQDVRVQNPDQQERIYCNRVTLMISFCTNTLRGPHRGGEMSGVTCGTSGVTSGTG